jgi:signal transduction histidine kinase/ligand-binding sensor domain-containing protein
MRTLTALKLCLATFCMSGLFPAVAHGVDPNRRITQYGHTAWRLQDGFFTGVPQAVAQTADGYLWIGTANGLFRFDGVRFVPLTTQTGERVTSNVTSLLTAKDGSLWFTTESQLEHLHDGVLTHYNREDQRRRMANTALQAADGSIWVTFSRQPFGSSLCSVDGLKLRCYGAPDGVPLPFASHIAEDTSGTFWISNSSQLLQWRREPGKSRLITPAALQSVDGLSSVTALTPSPDGCMWIGYNIEGPRLGLQHVCRDEWSPIKLPGFDSTQIQVGDVRPDREGSLWIGTDGDGLYRVNGRRVDHYRAADGLSGDSILSIFEDHEGDVWVCTSRGLDKFRDVSVVTLSTSEGLKSGHADSVVAGAGGALWIGGDRYLERYQDGNVLSLSPDNGLPGSHVTSQLEDSRGRLWVGVDNSLFVYTSGRFIAVNKSDGKPMRLVFDIAEDTTGTIWAVTPLSNALYRVTDVHTLEGVPGPVASPPRSLGPDRHGGLWVGFGNGTLAHLINGKWTIVSVNGGKKVNRIDQVLVTSDDAVIARTDGGIAGWLNGQSRELSVANGLPCQKAYSLILDHQGDLWAYAECGLMSIRRSELQRWWADPGAKIEVQMLDVYDGVTPGAPTFRPSGASTPDGTLWFANATSLQQVNPTNLRRDKLPPPVYVEAFVADKKPYPLNTPARLPPLSKDIAIEYTALSYPIPERVRFRYRLDGWDQDWQDASTRRQAFYTNLRPGSYRFHVIACNGDGVWNETGATISFSITPRYYQTTWFQILCVLALLLLTWSLYLLRVQQATARIQERLGARLEERERIARELHDTLLQGVQGLMLRFQGIMKTLPADQPTHNMMNDALDRADELMLQARQGVKDIRAAGMAESDLPDMLKSCAEDLRQDHAASLKLTFAGTPRPLDVTVCAEVYRIAREAMTNAFQHSGAPNIEVDVTYQPDYFRVSVRDDGQGIEPRLLSTGKAGHWGLSGMRERAEKIGGRLRILSQRATGTEVELTVPGRLAYAKTVSPSLWDKIKRWNSKEDDY